MDKLQEIREYMNQMQIKKVWFGGYDKEEVQVKFDVVYAMFQKCMKDQEEKEKALISDYEKRIKDLQNEFESKKKVSDILIVELNKSINSLTEENQSMVQKQQEMKEAYKGYCGDILKQYSDSLRLLSNEFSRILENVSNMQKGINEENIFEGLERAFEMRNVAGLLAEEEEFEKSDLGEIDEE